MVEVLEKSNQIQEVEKREEKKYRRIAGITLWRIFAYLIIYSVLGYIIETLFGVARYRYVRKQAKLFIWPFLCYLWNWCHCYDNIFTTF